MKLTFLVDNKTEHPQCKAEWGLSILIETMGHTYLYDTGSSSMFRENARYLGVDLSEVEAVMISHGHYDHTNGLEAFMSVNQSAKVYIHEEALEPAFGEDDSGNIEDENCGIQWSREFSESLHLEKATDSAETTGSRLVLTHNMVHIGDNLTLIGNIPDYPEFPPTERFFRIPSGRLPSGETSCGSCFQGSVIAKDGRKLIPDSMNHEQFLVVEEDNGIHIISGCCHKGAMPTVLFASELFPGREILSFTGGMHTYRLNPEERDRLASNIKKAGVKKVLPLHCTGMNMIVSFRHHFGDDCLIPCSGSSFTL